MTQNSAHNCAPYDRARLLIHSATCSKMKVGNSRLQAIRLLVQDCITACKKKGFLLASMSLYRGHDLPALHAHLAA
eukprot:1156043-Pelagomonas_calceolata.AAC.3